MAGYRLFFPFRDMPTLIWIKEKEVIFCAGGASWRPPVDIGPVAKI
jgi:predicted pyridoxine 5'-phosphate oxidase superfamily flavin-nucleotide-binding protein